MYLSPRHRDDPGAGCLMAALASEAPRQGAPVRKAITESIRSTFEFLTNFMPNRSKQAKREKAIATYASLVGGIILARAVEDRALSNEILEAVVCPSGGEAFWRYAHSSPIPHARVSAVAWLMYSRRRTGDAGRVP